MPKKTARNSEILKSSKIKTSPKLYPLLVELVNDDKEELAEAVLKTDYLLEYASSCIRQRDYNEAKTALNKAKDRIDSLKENDVDVDYLLYLFEGISKKVKIK
ncbi:hypothetical protein OXPF_40660 [Oxobacter pfennigii]|uniref:Uncharacterized protein n=1 Tax=Oxobacter pfennigii TaxID=36849 RepID=A0A0P8WVL2_9CLOT|nr:hypothetical protein [Oxobacter pfennigii]KPU42281.1 hypothetical protein OXPF_40660 [Oxobacter pfennigii]